MDDENISVEECMKRMHKSREYILNGIQQNVFPGMVVVSDGGRRNPHIPRKPFEDYMTKYRPDPTQALITALFNFVGDFFPNSKEDLISALINALQKEKSALKDTSRTHKL